MSHNPPRLQVRDLYVGLLQGQSVLPLVRGVSFDLFDGQTRLRCKRWCV